MSSSLSNLRLVKFRPVNPLAVSGIRTWYESDALVTFNGNGRVNGWGSKTLAAPSFSVQFDSDLPIRATYLNDRLASVQCAAASVGKLGFDDTPIANASAATFIFALRIPHNVVSGGYILAKAEDIFVGGNRSFIFSWLSGAVVFQVVGAAPITLQAPLTAGKFALVSVRLGTTCDLRINRVTKDTGGAFGGFPASAASILLGSGGTDEGLINQQNVNVLGLLIYTARLSDANLVRLEERLLRKFGDCRDEPLPDAPSNLHTTDVQDFQVSLAWTSHSTGNETGFEVQRFTVGGVDWLTVGTTGAGVTTFTDGNQINQPPETGFDNYLYRVRAVNWVGNSEWSAGIPVP